VNEADGLAGRELDQDVGAVRRRQQQVGVGHRLLEKAAVGRDQVKQPIVRERKQEVAGVGGVDQAQPDETAFAPSAPAGWRR
jgi:hypothetical protein